MSHLAHTNPDPQRYWQVESMGQWPRLHIALKPPEQGPPPDLAEMVKVAGLLQGCVAGHTVDHVPKNEPSRVMLG